MLALRICAVLGLATVVASAEPDGSFLWGPYRPNLYLGLRPRIPNSLLLGLMWAGVRDGDLGEIPSKHASNS
jgi:mannosyl-oligosaccharide glucosidase